MTETATIPATYESRDAEWCRQRLAAFDRAALRRAVEATHTQLLAAIRDGQDATAALTQHVLAMRYEVAAFKEAASHCATLGVEPQSVLGHNPISSASAYVMRDHTGQPLQSPDSELAAAILSRAVVAVTAEIIQTHEAELAQERQHQASAGGQLQRPPRETADQRRARRQQEYREELRRNGVDPDLMNGVNVEGMTELERQRIGVPPGRTPQGGYWT